MNARTTLITSSLIAASLVSGAAHAALQGRDLNGSLGSFEAYYDTDLNITWLADANYGAGSIYDNSGVFGNTSTDGRMSWANANAWAASLSFTDGVNVYNNWRLPTTLQPDASCTSQSGGDSYGLNCTGSEMGHLFYTELGGVAGQSIQSSADPDLAGFTNLPAGDYAYWSASAYAPSTANAWSFHFGYGGQAWYGKDAVNGLYALAVSSGDIGAVPEADTWAMLLVGLALVGVATKRRCE